ncbi:HRDC domain-containing protein [Mucilaginibacter sp. PAMB04168]|uniref:HRDC domain-containing protein n=1 Tax=Mucilaginibacter sp. PAMB04168 TaxID=3138567 RepID=UPI0031F617D4
MNAPMRLAHDYLELTNTVVFLTGKAGTGKTTFLRQVRQESKKKMAIVAPTGVAAINAGGMTIHSLFQLPFGPIMPGGAERPEVHYNNEKKELLNSLELLVIDEVSMVRPDVLDQIDLILRNVKDNTFPFGGVQLLLIGDLSQLSPIIKDEEWAILRRYYETPYFFSSQVLQKAPYVRIELDHVYRQKEQAFVEILNEVRNQSISQENLALLNARYIPDFRPPVDDPYITLTTHNSITRQINEEFITVLAGQEMEFAASIRGEFPKDAYPTETSLKLKVGAQVMFVKNDNSAEKLYYNGKIGTVTRLETDTVYVRCGHEDKELAVQAQEWTNVKYQLQGEQIGETNAGSFAQIPLKLAWSITIHKSQGLTFEKAIIDVSGAFTHGQAYVALSRCRSLAGMVLRNPIAPENIIGDPAVSRFNEKAKAFNPDEASLKRDIELHRQFMLSELFNFNVLKRKSKGFEALITGLQKDIFEVAEKLQRQLSAYPLDRIQKAAIYFKEKLETLVNSLHSELPGLIGQSKELAGKADELIRYIMMKIKLMDYFTNINFTSQAYVAIKRDVWAGVKSDTSRSYLKALNAKPNEKLYEQFGEWRKNVADKEKVMPNMILSEKTMATIAERLPATIKALSQTKGVGEQKALQYGAELISMIRLYQQELTGVDTEQGSLF